MMSNNEHVLKININSLAQNRAEEFGYDLSNDFVLPPIYEKIDFQKSAKPKIFIGGRGCGKTMLLRFLSHKTTFSITKEKISDEALNNIGLYWKADTHIVHQLQKRGLEADVWGSAFEHLFTTIIAIELIDSLESIAHSNYDKFESSELQNHKIEVFKKMGIGFHGNLLELKKFLNDRLGEFQFWLSNVRTGNIPDFYPKSLLNGLVIEIKSSLSSLSNTVFNIYLDEYENLLLYQQTIINTWVKHSEIPVVFHLAMKKNAFLTKQTIGNESLSEVHDYRVHDLEEHFNKPKEFIVFAGEILLYRLFYQGNLSGVDFDPLILTDISGFNHRKTDEYQSFVLRVVDRIFPSLTAKEMANSILDDTVLRKRLFEKLKLALKRKKSKISVDSFIYYDDLRVSLVSISLLNRSNVSARQVLAEIGKLRDNKENKFFNSTDWVNNNFVGSYLQFYAGLNRVCPFYTGFRTFSHMASGNIRHLMELCYKTFLRASDKNTSDMIIDIWKITIEHQAQASRQASTTFLNEIKTFGRYGNQLHTFIMRLGTLFSLAHENPKQSEPEQNHFSMVHGNHDLDLKFQNLFNEAVKWSVLFEQKSTKKKSSLDPDFVEYVINPIYAPYFHISYRKKRKLEFTTDTIEVLLGGSLDQYRALLKKYKINWEITSNSLDKDLFSELNS